MVLNRFRHCILRISWVSGKEHDFVKMMMGLSDLVVNSHNNLIRQNGLHQRCVCCHLPSLEFAGNVFYLHPTNSRPMVPAGMKPQTASSIRLMATVASEASAFWGPLRSCCWSGLSGANLPHSLSE